MKVTKYLSSIQVQWPIFRYSIDWDRKVSKPQKKVKDFLQKVWMYDRVLEEALIPGCKKRIDLVNLTKMIVVEISPDSVHKNLNKFFHGNNSGLYKKMKADSDKEEWCKSNGFEYVSLDDSDLKNLNLSDIEAKYGVKLS